VNLIKGNFWKTLAILLLMFIAMFLIRSLFGLINATIIAILRGGISRAQDFMVNIIKFQSFPLVVVAGIISLFLQPFRAAVIVLLYYDIRVRKEAYDLEVMAKELTIE